MEGSEKNSRRRFASLTALAVRARQTIERFPLVLLFAIGAAVVLHRLADIDFDAAAGATPLIPVLMTLVLGIPLFLSIQLLAESRGWSGRTQLLATVFGLLLAWAYYMLVPFPIRGGEVFRFFQFIAALHLLVAFGPFVGRGRGENGFWHYNKVLFLRFALGALYSAVLFIGLSLALAACENLLGFDLDNEVYLQLWFWIVFAYNTWFFLAGIPEDLETLEQVQDYPTGLRIFTQYVLIPLVLVYLIILYAYMAKIVIEWDLPKGWVGFPVIGVAVAGMLALLLVYPIRERSEIAWITKFAKYFHWSLFPLIVLISVAIGTRISEYGVTENRYAVVVLTAWLLAIAIYFTFRRRKDIRVIPVSLCIVAVVTAFGPWSATAFSRSSQLARLQELLIGEEVMTDGVLDATPKRIEFEPRKGISNIVKYIHDFHGLNRIRDWYAEPERLVEEPSYEVALQEMGLEYISPWTDEPDGFAIDANVPSPLAINGFDHLYQVSEFWDDEPSRFRVGIDSATVLALEGAILQLGPPGDPRSGLSADLTPMLSDLRERDSRGEPLLLEATTLELENDRYRLVMYLAAASGKFEGDSLEIRRLSATVLVQVK